MVSEFKLLVTNDDSKKMIEKLDNVCMIYVLHGLHKNYESVRSQILTAPDIPSTEKLIDRLIRLPSQEGTKVNGPQTGVESSAFANNFSSRGGRGCFRGAGRGGRGGGHSQCTYCKRFGHTEDKCYSLIGFPEKSVNVIEANDNGKDLELKNTKTKVISDDEYKAYQQFKAYQSVCWSLGFGFWSFRSCYW